MGFRKIDARPPKGFEPPHPGPAPMLQWIDIASLVVDEAYQRELKIGNWKSIQRIAANFRWSRFSPVFVAPVEGGLYAIIDGQHRCHAAMLCGHTAVPCQVVQMDQREQAEAFAAVNGMVTKVTAWNLYRASLAAGEGWAVRCDRLARAAGCELMTNTTSSYAKKPGQIFGVTHFRKVTQGRDDAVVVSALKLLRSAEGWGDDAAYWEAGTLMPVLQALCERPHVLKLDAFKPALEQFDIWSVLEADKTERKRRIQMGLPYVPKSETLITTITTWIDKNFAQRMALPGPKPSRRDMLDTIGRIEP